MKFSEISESDLKNYAREDDDSSETNKLFEQILISVKSYIKGYTGLSESQIDDKEDLVMVVFVLSNELYDNRSFTVQNDKVNYVVKSILDLHSVNFL